jgi:hypothetical protein
MTDKILQLFVFVLSWKYFHGNIQETSLFSDAIIFHSMAQAPVSVSEHLDCFLL